MSLSKRRALITGVTGQDGSYLAELLLEKGYEVHGFARRRTKDIPGVFLHLGDLTDRAALGHALAESDPHEVYNLGAQSHVAASFQEPEYTVEATTRPLITVLEHARASGVRAPWPRLRVYHASCYDEQTRVLTTEGLKTFNEVKVGDTVLTTNLETNEIEVKAIKRVIVEKYSGEMIRISGKRLDLLVTPNHRILLHGNTGLFYTEAGRIQIPPGERFLARSSSIKLPNPDWKGKKREVLKLSEIAPCEIPCNAYKNLLEEIETDDLFWLTGLYIGDGYTAADRVYTRSASKEDFISKHDERGHFVSQEKKEVVTYSSYNLYFAIPERDKSRKRLIRWLEKYKVDYRTSADWVRFSSCTLANFLKMCGESAQEKHIPAWMLGFARAHLQALFEGLIGSDGHARPNGKSFSYITVSKSLVPQVVELVIKLGLRCSTADKPGKDVVFIREQRVIHSNDAYDIFISDNHDERPITLYPEHVSVGLYNGMVWCLEVEDNHNFVVERNGRYAFCGNSSEMFGDAPPPQNEQSPFRPRSPYAIAKVAAHQLVGLYREAYGVFAVGGILFNHEGPRRAPSFVTRKITQGVARVFRGEASEIVLGNLDARRDWSFAGDMVKGMWLMLQQDAPKDYVLASGSAHSVRDFVEVAFRVANELTGRDLAWQDYVKTDPRFLRPAEVPHLLGNATRACQELGWRPEVNFEGLVRLMVEADLGTVRKTEPDLKPVQQALG
jgi:GDP-D-mannose dehydratase